MVSVSLLQRLEKRPSELTASNEDSQESAVFDSVLKDLRILMNSARGCCETRPDYGLSDFNSHGESLRGAIGLIARDIERQVKRFEPRLRNVVVRATQDEDRPLEFIFHVDGELAYNDKSVPVKFASVLGSDGHIRFD